MSKCTDKDIVTREAMRILKSNALTIKKAKANPHTASAEMLDDFCKDVINPTIKKMAKKMKKAKAKKRLS